MNEQTLMAMLKEYARRAANKCYWRHQGKYVPADSDELSQWAKKRVDMRIIVHNVMAKLSPDKYEPIEY